MKKYVLKKYQVDACLLWLASRILLEKYLACLRKAGYIILRTWYSLFGTCLQDTFKSTHISLLD